MKPPKNAESRPWAGTGSHANATSPAPKITQAGPRSGAVSSYVSLYAPTERRRCWWYAYRCGHCNEYQLGRARDLDRVTGVRRARCGHLIEIVIARIYGQERAA